MMTSGYCQICGEKIEYNSETISNLGKHFMQKHPNEDLGYFMLYENENQKKNDNSDIRRIDKSKTIKTTIESWKQARISYKCPECNFEGAPLIKRQRHKLTKSTIGACILLGCWPICFLPFILGGSDLMHIYCTECGHYFGMFDRRQCNTNKESNA